MKKPLFIASLFVLLFAVSCSNDFNVIANWKDIPVVYGLLNIGDTAHYIRVERAFLDPEANALEQAKIIDSIYYDDAIVQLERVSNGQVFTLEKVDGNLEGYVRESGVFADEPNWLYKIDSSVILLKAGETIRLRIDRGDGLPEVTSSTLILGASKLNAPGNNSAGFNFPYNLMEDVSWTAADSAVIFDVTLYIQYVEYPQTDPSAQVKKTIEWPWARGLRRESSSDIFIVKKQGIAFFETLNNHIEEDPDMKRVFTGIDVEIIAGGKALENFVNVGLANTGITGANELPTYSNLSEGKGVFTSVHKLHRNAIGLTTTTRDSLKNGYLTKNLNF
ncbi:MAG: DUF4249 family protein [Bacteroidetes bacterium]|nr:DUF4249 family protein [Bacteroidota bacterium]